MALENRKPNYYPKNLNTFFNSDIPFIFIKYRNPLYFPLDAPLATMLTVGGLHLSNVLKTRLTCFPSIIYTQGPSVLG
jgi:hypothetical protein